MDNNKSFKAYEYKKITVKGDSAALYADCLQNFGWTPVEDRAHGYSVAQMGFSAMSLGTSIAGAVSSSSDSIDDMDMVTLKFRRDSRIANKRELDRLERQCMEELQAISKVETGNNAKTMGISLGSGILGAAATAGAVLSFRAGAILPGVLFLIPAIAGWALGFFFHVRLRKTSEEKSAAKIDQHFDEIYATCETAHSLLIQG